MLMKIPNSCFQYLLSIHCLLQSTTHTLYIHTHINMYRLLLLSLGPYIVNTEDCCLLHQTINYIYTCVMYIPVVSMGDI